MSPRPPSRTVDRMADSRATPRGTDAAPRRHAQHRSGDPRRAENRPRDAGTCATGPHDGRDRDARLRDARPGVERSREERRANRADRSNRADRVDRDDDGGIVPVWLAAALLYAPLAAGWWLTLDSARRSTGGAGDLARLSWLMAAVPLGGCLLGLAVGRLRRSRRPSRAAGTGVVLALIAWWIVLWHQAATGPAWRPS